MSLINKYQPKNCKVKTWADIEYSFDNWFEGQHKNNIADLVRHIQKTVLSDKLFGLTSMNKLVVGIYDPIDWDRETLHITFDTEKNEWHFVYYAITLPAARIC